MENWGLVTYRQTQYLYNQGVTSQSTEQAIAGTIVHEIVHMWFGDIVSPLWWNDAWLNEGFARYLQYVGAAYIEPKYQMVIIIIINYIFFYLISFIKYNSYLSLNNLKIYFFQHFKLIQLQIHVQFHLM